LTSDAPVSYHGHSAGAGIASVHSERRAAVEILFCDECRKRVDSADIESNKAYVGDDAIYCAECAKRLGIAGGEKRKSRSGVRPGPGSGVRSASGVGPVPRTGSRRARRERAPSEQQRGAAPPGGGQGKLIAIVAGAVVVGFIGAALLLRSAGRNEQAPRKRAAAAKKAEPVPRPAPTAKVPATPKPAEPEFDPRSIFGDIKRGAPAKPQPRPEPTPAPPPPRPAPVKPAIDGIRSMLERVTGREATRREVAKQLARGSGPVTLKFMWKRHPVRASDGVFDTGLVLHSEKNRSKNYAEGSVLNVKSGGTGARRDVALFFFDLDVFGRPVEVRKAFLYLWSHDGAGGQVKTHAARVLTEWNDITTTGAERLKGVPWSAGHPKLGVDIASPSEATALFVERQRYYSFDVTGAVKRWVADPKSNRGLAIYNEGRVGTMQTISSQANESRRPYLEVTVSPK